MQRMLNKQRFEEMVEVINASVTETQRKHRAKLFIRLMQLIEDSHYKGESEAALYVRLWQDPPLWTLGLVRDEQGRPMFLSPWQCRFWAMLSGRRRLMGLMTRKAGKTTILAVVLAHSLCGPKPTRTVAFSPSEGQSFIYDKCRIYVTHSEYLRDTFLRGPETRDTDRELISSSGATVVKGYVSQNTKGEQARGQYGDMIIVDEVQSIAKEILDEIVEPMVADAFSGGDKKLIYIGTPHTRVNPDLPEQWKRYRSKSLNSNEYGTFSIDCWGAIEEGCIDRNYVLEQQQHLPADVFAREYEAIFPDTSDGYLSQHHIKKCIRVNETFKKPSQRNPEAMYVMAVDWARHRDRTQAVVAKVDPKRPRIDYVDWLEFDHKASSDYDYVTQATQVLDMFWSWGCRWIIPDSSGTQDMVLDMLKKGVGGKKGIPDFMIYGYEQGKSQQKNLGFKATRESNYNMYVNHKNLIMNMAIHIPGAGKKEKAFVKRFTTEHANLMMVETSTGIKFDKPRNGYKDLVSACAMLSLIAMDKQPRTGASTVGAFGTTRTPLSDRRL